MSNMEEYNYWNDPRVRAGMIDRGTLVKDAAGIHLCVEQEDDADIEVRCKWGVCPTCSGNGVHTNPSIDASGLTQEDFDEDPNFFEAYTSGQYDVQCTDCKGKRVVPEVDRNGSNAAMLERYDEYIQDQRDSAAETAAERRMGA